MLACMDVFILIYKKCIYNLIGLLPFRPVQKETFVYSDRNIH
jgi:hypothetical protein